MSLLRYSWAGADHGDREIDGLFHGWVSFELLLC